MDRPLHIALAGPMTLSLLEPALGTGVASAGFPFPATARLVLDYLEAGHRVTAVTTGFDIAHTVRVARERLEVVVVPSRSRGRGRAFDLFRAERRAIRAVLDASGADVVHAHWTYEFGLAARAAAPPALVTVHDWAPAIARFNRHPYWYFRCVMQVLCLMQRGALTAPSTYIATRVRRWYRQRCAVVPNGVELARFSATLPARSGAVVAMLNVGFTERKNVGTALRAWPAVRRAVPDAELVLAGPDFEADGPAARWAAERGLTDGVRFEGPLDPADVPAWLTRSTLFLHTSREESFGIVLVEAMAAGLPVVVGAASGGAADVVRPAGATVDVDDADAVARIVIELLGDDVRRAEMTRAGRARATNYDSTAVTARYLELLTALVDGGDDRSGTMETRS